LAVRTWFLIWSKFSSPQWSKNKSTSLIVILLYFVKTIVQIWCICPQCCLQLFLLLLILYISLFFVCSTT
jgi:hypothetical protein